MLFLIQLLIAGVARKFGLFSDSSQRYERGVDPYLQIKALERATALILSIVGGEAGPVIEASDTKHLPATVQFTFDTIKVKKLTGLVYSSRRNEKFIGRSRYCYYARTQ